MSVYYKEKPDFLQESLCSIYRQTRLSDEVILVEDGALTEELESIVRNYESKEPSLKVVRLATNQGLGAALNVGMKHCQYDYVIRMDSDDICFPKRFENLIAVVEDNPDLDVVGSWTQEFITDKNGEKIFTAVKRFPHTISENKRYSRKRCPVEHPAVILKKESVIKAGSYQPFYLYEDYYLWARMLVNGAKFYNIQEPLLYFRTSEDAIKRRGGWKYAKSEMHALWRFYKIDFINLRQYIFMLLTRIPIRLLPNKLRSIIYKKFLRR